MEEQAKNGQLPKTSSSSSNTAVNGDAKTDDSEENTREQSDKNINKFNRLVVYDKEQERKSKYQSEVRGRVQDRNVHVDLEPQFVLTYYEKADPVKKLVYYDKMVEDYNGQMVLKRKLRITNEEAALTEDQIAVHFASIDEYSAEIERDPNNANAYLAVRWTSCWCRISRRRSRISRKRSSKTRRSRWLISIVPWNVISN